MSMVTITSTCNINNSEKNLSFEYNPHRPRDVPFSSYMNSSENIFMHKLTDSSPCPKSVIKTQDEQLYLGRIKKEDGDEQLYLGRIKKEDGDGEIGVFGAEKYFKEDMDEEEPKDQPRTPSVVSESSWYSPSSVFQNHVVTHSPQSKTNNRQKRSFFASLKFKCSCFDKDSVTIDDSVGEISFKTANSSTKVPIKTGKNLNLITTSANDAESDASSDLFEIQSLSGKDHPFLPTYGCLTPRNCYAPSEASIEWSVVTASATDCDDQRSAISDRNGHSGSSKETLRRHPSILLGCKNHKAVRVAGNAYLTNEKVCVNPGMAMTRFEADAKLTGYGFRHSVGHGGWAARSLRLAHSPHISGRSTIR